MKVSHPRIKWTTPPGGSQFGLDEATHTRFTMHGPRLNIEFNGCFSDRYGKAVAEAFLDALHATQKSN